MEFLTYRADTANLSQARQCQFINPFLKATLTKQDQCATNLE